MEAKIQSLLAIGEKPKDIAEKLNGKGLVLLFEGIQTADVTQLRSKGFIDEISKHKDIQVIKRTGNFLRKKI